MLWRQARLISEIWTRDAAAAAGLYSAAQHSPSSKLQFPAKSYVLTLPQGLQHIIATTTAVITAYFAGLQHTRDQQHQ